MIKNNLVGVLVPTFNGGILFKTLIERLNEIEIIDKILIIDSHSSDKIIEELKTISSKVIITFTNDFNHGVTREYGRKLLKTDVVVMLTQDVIPISSDFIYKLVKPILNDEAVATYGRQIPHDNADIFEAFPREFNYPDYDIIKDKSKIKELGVYTFFFSNSFAAYDNKVLDEIGGFEPVLTNEDYIAAAKIIMKGYKIKYVADAIVKHSHKYSLIQEFQRYFDTGYVRRENEWIQKMVGQAEARGLEFSKKFLLKILKHNPLLFPYAFIQIIVKALGFRMGYYCYNSPIWLKKMLSSQKYYWSSKYYINKKANTWK